MINFWICSNEMTFGEWHSQFIPNEIEQLQDFTSSFLAISEKHGFIQMGIFEEDQPSEAARIAYLKRVDELFGKQIGYHSLNWPSMNMDSPNGPLFKTFDKVAVYDEQGNLTLNNIADLGKVLSEVNPKGIDSDFSAADCSLVKVWCNSLPQKKVGQVPFSISIVLRSNLLFPKVPILWPLSKEWAKLEATNNNLELAQANAPRFNAWLMEVKALIQDHGGIWEFSTPFGNAARYEAYLSPDGVLL